MVPPSDDESLDSLERLKGQLTETFGLAGNGSVNIRALRRLLHNLINLYARQEADRKKAAVGSPEPTKSCPPSKENDSVQKITPPAAASAGVPGEECRTKNLGSRKELDTTRNTGQWHVSNDSHEETGRATNISNGKDAGTVTPFRGSDTSALPIQPAVCEKRSFHIQGSQGSTIRKEFVISVPGSSTSSEQRSSDFNVKSTSSSSTSTQEAVVYGRERQSQPTRSNVPGGSPPNLQEVTYQSQEAISSCPSKSIPDVPGDGQSLPEFVAILEGCRSHLETVRDEVLALRERSRLQHDDTVQLAGGLDGLVERVGDQEPRLAKLEQDTHCLGMLISDYEQGFARIEKQLGGLETRVRELDRMLQRIAKDHDATRASLQTVAEQVSYLTNAKADKVDVQTELNRRALLTDLQQRVPYDVFNEGVRDLTRTVTGLLEDQYELNETLKTVQYELVRGLDGKAAAQEVSQLRKQLVGVLARWQRAEKAWRDAAAGGDEACIDFRSAAVAISRPKAAHYTTSSVCLSCGIKTTLETGKGVVPLAMKFVPSVRNRARNAGGMHTKCAAPEKVFRAGNGLPGKAGK